MAPAKPLPKHVYPIGATKILYLIRRVPEDIKRSPQFESFFGNKAQWKRSLGTSDWRLATSAYHALELEFDALVAQARSVGGQFRSKPRADGRHRRPDAEDYRYVAASVRRSARATHQAQLDGAYSTWEGVEAHQEFEDSRFPDGDAWMKRHEALRNPLLSRDQIDETMVEHAERMGLMVESDEEISRLRQAVVQGRRQAYEDIVAADALTPGFDRDNGTEPLEPPARRTLTDVLNEYERSADHDRKWIATLRSNVREFEEFLGEPKPINRIRRMDVQKYAEALQRCPKNLTQRFPGSTMIQAIEQNQEREAPYPTLARKTILDTKLAAIQTLFRFAKDSREWISESPAERIKIARSRDEDRSKRAFGVSNLNTLFEHPIWEGCTDPERPYKPGNVQIDDHRRWAPIALLYTGCRPAEIAALPLSLVDIDSSTPHIAIRWNEHGRIKTSNAERSIPLPDALRAHGFFDYVKRMKSAGHDRLFPQWERGGTHQTYTQADWVRAFNRTILRAQLGKSGSTLFGLYSFRKNFKKRLLDMGVSIQVHTQLMGHEPRYDEKAYTQTLPLEDTYTAVHSLDYAGLLIPGMQAAGDWG